MREDELKMNENTNKMRDRLIELLQKRSCFYAKCINSCGKCDCIPINDDYIGNLADYLLANGGIALPCKVGDTVYTNISMQGWYMRKKDRPYKAEVVFIGINNVDNFMNVKFENGNMLQFNFSQIGKTVFLSKEEAERALKGR